MSLMFLMLVKVNYCCIVDRVVADPLVYQRHLVLAACGRSRHLLYLQATDLIFSLQSKAELAFSTEFLFLVDLPSIHTESPNRRARTAEKRPVGPAMQ